MGYKDMYTMTTPSNTVPPQAVTDGTINGDSIDRKFYESSIILLHIGTYTDGSHEFTLQESDDDSTWTDVDSSEVLGYDTTNDEYFTTLDDGTRDDTVEHIGYIGVKRYIRMQVVTTGSTTGAVLGLSIVQDYPRYSGASQLTP